MTTPDSASRNLEAAPEAYRSRAHVAAGLITTMAAALAGGALFGGVERLPMVAGILGLACLASLIVGAFLFGAAGQHARRGRTRQSLLEQELETLVDEIQGRMTAGGIAVLIASLLFFAVVATTFYESRRTTNVEVLLRPGAATRLQRQCDEVRSGTIPGEVSRLPTRDRFLTVRVASKRCRTIRLSTDDILAVVEKTP